jgi:hypothetical protein
MHPPQCGRESKGSKQQWGTKSESPWVLSRGAAKRRCNSVRLLLRLHCKGDKPEAAGLDDAEAAGFQTHVGQRMGGGVHCCS